MDAAVVMSSISLFSPVLKTYDESFCHWCFKTGCNDQGAGLTVKP